VKGRLGDKGAQAADPLVSVVLPTFNRAQTLPRAIRSILAQDYENLEVLVVDDGSTDDTADVMAQFDDPRVRYLPQAANRGASRARNAGLRECRGEYIAFQDSDDEWLAGKLRRQVELAQSAGPGPVTVFHPKVMYGRDAQGVYGPYRVCCLPMFEAGSLPDFRRAVHEINIISPQALLINRAALEAVGPFDQRLVNNNDWAFAIDLIYRTRVLYIEDPLVMTYLQNDSISKIKRSGARSQLLIMRKLRRCGDVAPAVMGAHLCRIGWGLTKLGNPRLGRRVIARGLRLQPASLRNWARFAVTQAHVILGRGRR
jgi:glycosyltransferase involved in cell wall biosynthesis